MKTTKNITIKFLKDSYTDLADLKKAYLSLCKKHHPDAGGNAKDFIQLKKEYDYIFENFKYMNNIKAGANNPKYKETKETADLFKSIVDELLFKNINIEICGYWIWVDGSTYENKELLKELGFGYSKNKKRWYYDTLDNNKNKLKKYKHKYTMDEIRFKYGSQIIEGGSKTIQHQKMEITTL